MLSAPLISFPHPLKPQRESLQAQLKAKKAKNLPSGRLFEQGLATRDIIKGHFIIKVFDHVEGAPTFPTGNAYSVKQVWTKD